MRIDISIDNAYSHSIDIKFSIFDYINDCAAMEDISNSECIIGSDNTWFIWISCVDNVQIR
jgi:hypothetical protein